jgi:predicted peptidase
MTTIRAGRGLAIAALFAGAVAQSLGAQVVARPSSVTETSLELSDGTTIRYGIALPDGYDPASTDPRPLVLVLHPGGRAPYYGSSFMQSIVEPGLREWGAVMVAPDVPGGSWATPRSEGAVLALVEHVMREHAIDRERVLVTGFSMGGRGTWYMASRHADLFTGGIVMAGSAGDEEVAGMAVPLYLIHSPDDEVVSFDRAEAAYRALAERGHPVEMRVVPGLGHYMMGGYVPALRTAGRWMLDRW